MAPLESQNEIVLDEDSFPAVVFSRRKLSRTCLADIEQYFQQPPPQFLDLELAVCWVLECLLKDDNYPSGLLQQLMREEPQLRPRKQCFNRRSTSSSSKVPSAPTPSAAPAGDVRGGCCICRRMPAGKRKS